MISFEIAFAIVPGLILFLYGIEHFSQEIQKIAGEQFRVILTKLTSNPVNGALLGAIVTAVVQSSTATTVISVGLVDAGIITFTQSLGVIIGANIGTTLTAQLVALKLTSISPFFIFLGFVLSIFGRKYKFLGKPIFYFGLVFFSLHLISQAIDPVKTDPSILTLFSQFSNIYVAIAAGFLFTVLVQSSSVTTGLVVLLVGGGLISLDQGIPLVMGANIGTTLTSFLAALKMGLHAKRAAFAHFLFNFGGVIIFLPFIFAFSGFIESLGGPAAQQMANAHLIFNLIIAIIFLILIDPFSSLVKRLIQGKEDEILFRPKYLMEKLPQSNEKSIELIEKELRYSLDVTQTIFDCSIEMLTKGKSNMHRVSKLESLNDFLDDQISIAIATLSKRGLSRKLARRVVLMVRMSNANEQLGDLAKRLALDSEELLESRLVLSRKSISAINITYSKFSSNLKIISQSAPYISVSNRKKIRANDKILRDMITQNYKDHLKRISSQKTYASSVFVDFLAGIESSNAKLREIRKFSEIYSRTKI
ncbi:MAG: Na/Pi cotransporter family protein [Candidatus Micrarchaeota archaeon]